jgi:creatinine amidohydrolase
MKVLPRYWADCVSTDFSELDPLRTVAVLPLGATEQHGPHLPLSVDTDLVNAMVSAALMHLQDSGPGVAVAHAIRGFEQRTLWPMTARSVCHRPT